MLGAMKSGGQARGAGGRPLGAAEGASQIDDVLKVCVPREFGTAAREQPALPFKFESGKSCAVFITYMP